MNQQTEKVDPLICPLCGRKNACVNLANKDTSKSCWCNDPTIIFPKGLLSMVPPESRGKACICKDCVMKYDEEMSD